MLYDQLVSSKFETIPVFARAGLSSEYELEMAPISVEARAGDFWAEAQEWTGASRLDVVLQQTMICTQAIIRSRIWRENLYSAPDAVVSNAAIFATVRSVRRAIETFGPVAIDLAGINLPDTNPTHLIAVLRAAYAWRTVITGWQDAIRSAPEILERHGINSKRELAGLTS